MQILLVTVNGILEHGCDQQLLAPFRVPGTPQRREELLREHAVRLEQLISVVLGSWAHGMVSFRAPSSAASGPTTAHTAHQRKIHLIPTEPAPSARGRS
jgi:hypothetical protein